MSVVLWSLNPMELRQVPGGEEPRRMASVSVLRSLLCDEGDTDLPHNLGGRERAQPE